MSGGYGPVECNCDVDGKVSFPGDRTWVLKSNVADALQVLRRSSSTMEPMSRILKETIPSICTVLEAFWWPMATMRL